MLRTNAAASPAARPAWTPPPAAPVPPTATWPAMPHMTFGSSDHAVLHSGVGARQSTARPHAIDKPCDTTRPGPRAVTRVTGPGESASPTRSVPTVGKILDTFALHGCRERWPDEPLARVAHASPGARADPRGRH